MGLLFLQLAAAPVAATATPPDIELNAHVQAREVTIREEAPVRLSLHAEPGNAPPVKVTRSAPGGAKSYRNLTLDLHGEARVVDPRQAQSQQGNDNAETKP
ncbi:MAG: hypothetical protein JOZ05_19665 [Acetobacteraceae bacterium]|nr:hypothetical protein [Acetobacteraceae bacterium]